MKITKHLLLVTALLVAAACGNSSMEASATPAQKTKMLPADHAAPASLAGTVAETMNAANYTYVLLDTGKEKVWFAGPACVVKVGDRLTIPAGMLKENFTSKTLNRTFEKIYFTETLMAPEGAGVCKIPPSQATGVSAVADESMAHTAAPAPAGLDFAGIQKPAGGKTVAEIYAQKKDLAGKKVILRGKVVKFNAEIMGKNWAHVQDGTGAAGQQDITVTTQGTAKPGDTVLVEGTLTLDKDFGYGYKYGVLIEDATLKRD